MNPFDLDDDASYRRWRQWKLDCAPRRADDLVVVVEDPLRLNEGEIDALAARCQISNLAFYFGPASVGEDKELPRVLGAAFGLLALDANWLADEDGVSSITPGADERRRDFIPYTERPIRWHTDGYYNAPDRQIRSMLLHCVRPALRGGENAVMDHEMAYILLRDENPEYVRALSAPHAMTIPARENSLPVGATASDVGPSATRAEQSGPVFSVDAPSGDLHMRYTARTRSIVWAGDALTQAATGFLLDCLESTDGRCPWVYRLRMAAGMGLLCNNVLHDRGSFSDAVNAPSAARRLLYRARFHDRIAQTVGSYRAAFL